MILKVAVLNVRPGMEADFEAAFRHAAAIISSIDVGVAHLVPIRGPGRPDPLPPSPRRLDLSPGILGRLRRVPAP